jgi:hypothetical protein
MQQFNLVSVYLNTEVLTISNDLKDVDNYKPRTPRHPALQQYTATLDAFASLSVTTALRHRVSISEIYRCLKQEEGYTGSYGAVRGTI